MWCAGDGGRGDRGAMSGREGGGNGQGGEGGGGAGTGSDATHGDGWRPWWWGASVSVEVIKRRVWALIGEVARHTDPPSPPSQQLQRGAPRRTHADPTRRCEGVRGPRGGPRGTPDGVKGAAQRPRWRERASVRVHASGIKQQAPELSPPRKRSLQPESADAPPRQHSNARSAALVTCSLETATARQPRPGDMIAAW